jgi:hypothetical protein
VYFDHLEVIVSNEQPDYVVGLAEFLKEAGRPLFEEDLPAQYHSLFNELESFPYPDQVIVKGSFLFLEFKNADEDLLVSKDQLLESLLNMRLKAVVVFTLNAEEEWEEEADCSKFYRLEDQQLKRFSAEVVKQQTGLELDERFDNSEEILWRLVDSANF